MSPGLGVLLVFAALLLTGALVSNVAGRWWLKQLNRLFANVPVFETVGQQRAERCRTRCSGTGTAFRTALLVQYRGRGLDHCVPDRGAQRGSGRPFGPGFVSVYVPTTPNPTSGFFLIVPRAEVIELQMSVMRR